MNPVQQQVQALYERYPYPPAPDDLDGYRDGKLIPFGSPQAYFHLYWPSEEYRDDLDILVAGCGTTQAAALALRQAQANVVGIDISAASLEQSRAHAKRYNITNLTLRQLPVEQVEQLDQQFDLIIATGILHHLDDPDAGLRALRGILNADGAMFIMLYGQYGRTGVYMFQQYCRLLGVSLDAADLTDLQSIVQLCPPDHPLRPMFNVADLKDPAALADLLLHPRDRAYTVPEIYAWLDRNDMHMHRWVHQAPYLPQCCALVDTPHADRVMNLPPRQQHAVVELFGGSINKHTFIATRDDCPANHDTIDFDSDRWRNCVPQPFPGITVETDKLPPGILARLRNPQHDDPQIKVDLNRDQVHLYQAMNGQRTIVQIAAAADIPGDGQAKQRCAKDCFQTLWHHDQVFFKINAPE